ncbi:unnamed protein product [Arctia plantaginis]|uniref:Uncharacterized protein n=1 Tax=Arctia plantaginis TaxID=874455 RepID=A0A8S0ZT86_ARCPL|nr:unnamed protein product [Arctia plantaginis]
MEKDKKENQKQINNLSKQIRESMRKDRKYRRIQTLENHISRTGGTRKALKELREQGKEWIPKLTDKNMSSTSRRKIQNIATNYYRLLYKEHSPNQPKIQLPDRESNSTQNCMMEDSEVIPEILVSEVEKSIKSQKMEKPPVQIKSQTNS